MTGMASHSGFTRVLGFLSLICGLLAGQAHGASSILIWPINPVIEADSTAVALWLENRGRVPVDLQIRVMRWEQVDYEDRLTAQREVVGSPPVVTIEPGRRQMIRLMAMQPPPAASQQAYRVLIDEMLGADADSDPRMGVKFQMRYSIPLFLYGSGAVSAAASGKAGKGLQILQPALNYQVEQDGQVRYLVLRNTGGAHARLSSVTLGQGSRRQALAQGLLGYVLPGADMRWPLPAGLPQSDITLEALVNGSDEPLTIPER